MTQIVPLGPARPRASLRLVRVLPLPDFPHSRMRPLSWVRAAGRGLTVVVIVTSCRPLVDGLESHDVVGEVVHAGPRQPLPRGGVDRQRPGRAEMRGPPHTRYKPNTRLDGDQREVMGPAPFLG